MHKLKKPEELIIEDKKTRALLLALLGKWGDPQSEALVREIDILIQEYVALAIARLQDGHSFDYHYETIVKGNKGETSDDPTIHRLHLCEEAAIYFQSSIGLVVGTMLGEMMKAIVKAASDHSITQLESKVKAVKKLGARHVNRDIGEAIGISKPLGRPIAYKKADVQRRSIAIIRTIKPGKHDKGKVAVAFYSDFGESKPFKKGQITKAYNEMTTGRRQLLLNKFNNLFKSKKLSYDDLVSQATDNSRSRKGSK